MGKISEIMQRLEHIDSEKTSTKLCDLDQEKILVWIKKRGIEVLKSFEIPKNQERFYLNAFCYFKGFQGDFDNRKGLLISGTIGTGKTTAMQVLQNCFKNFPIVNTRYVIREFMSEDKPALVIDRYGRNSYYKNPGGVIDKSRPINYCFDDFGLENIKVKNYGNDQNVMEEVILDRYDEWKSKQMKTYGTSNLDPTNIQDAYGVRVRDRIKEMMNYVTIQGESKRK